MKWQKSPIKANLIAVTNYLGNSATRRELPKSPPYLRLKNFQGTTIFKNIGNIWKNFFFSKKYLVKKSRTMPEKPKKWSFRLIKRFLLS